MANAPHFTTFYDIFDISLQISGATCISDAVYWANSGNHLLNLIVWWEGELTSMSAKFSLEFQDFK